MKSIFSLLALAAVTYLFSGCEQTGLQEAIFDPMGIEPESPSLTYRVKPGSVHDGDTFQATTDATNEEIKIRLACIDAPELEQPGGIEARDYLRGMLQDNREIILSIREKDRYGRSLAEVFVPIEGKEEEIAVNGEMVLAGMAHYYPRNRSACPLNAESYELLEQQAIANKAGVWANGDAERPWDWRKQNN